MDIHETVEGPHKEAKLVRLWFPEQSIEWDHSIKMSTEIHLSNHKISKRSQTCILVEHFFVLSFVPAPKGTSCLGLGSDELVFKKPF